MASPEAADYLGIHLATITRWAKAGKVAFYLTPGGQRRFSKADLDELLTSMRVKRK